MFSLGIFEILAILIVALLILGPKKFPQMAKELAQMIHKLRAVQEDINQQAKSFKNSATEIKDEVQKTIEKATENSDKKNNSNESK